MAEVRAVPDADRLPWLTDDIRPAKRGQAGLPLFWGLTAAALVAAGSYWLGSQTPVQPPVASERVELRSSAPAAEIARPEDELAQPAFEEVEPAPMPQVEPVPEMAPVIIRTMEAPKIAEPAPVDVPETEPVPPSSELAAESSATAAAAAGPAQATVDQPPAPEPAAVAARLEKPQPSVRTPLRPWPAAQSAGAAGRMVRIGTFASRYQAKRAWWRVMRTYPGLRRLKAVVVPVASLRNGRTYYRLQFGTTSHAHSVVLCQRMRIVGQSCVPVGLPAGQSA